MSKSLGEIITETLNEMFPSPKKQGKKESYAETKARQQYERMKYESERKLKQAQLDEEILRHKLDSKHIKYR